MPDYAVPSWRDALLGGLRPPPSSAGLPAIPKAPEPTTLGKLLAVLQGATGLPLTDPGNYERGGEDLDRYAAGGELASMLLGPLAVASVVAKAAKPPIRAYHGSPYDFEKFEAAKIGSGEGGQMYGHGLYFAERPEVAGSYKRSNRPDPHLVNPTGQLPDDVLAELQRVGYLGFDRPGQAVSAIRSDPNWKTTWDVPEHLPATEQYVKQYPGGRLYEVDIHADPEAMLDWDKPLGQQPPHVQERFRWYGIDDPSLSAVEAYNRLGGTEGIAGATQKLTEGPKGAPEIPGIRYLDQGSRELGAGSSNYVIFDESKIDILKKLALLLGIGGTGAAASQEGAP